MNFLAVLKVLLGVIFAVAFAGIQKVSIGNNHRQHCIVHAWSLNTKIGHKNVVRLRRLRKLPPQQRTVVSSSSLPSLLSSSSSEVDRGDQDAPVLVREELGCSPTLSVIANFFAKLNSNLATSSSYKSSSSTSSGANAFYSSGHSSSSSPSFFFDPLNLATDQNFASYREAELKHCRVACLAVVGSVGVTYYNDNEVRRILGDVWKQWFASSAFLQQKSQSDDNGIIEKITSISGQSSSVPGSMDNVQLLEQLRRLPIPQPLHLLQGWTVGDFTRMIFVCGIMETLVWVQIDPQAMPGDYGTGYFGVRDKGLNERSLVSELENGRLCMIVMLYYVICGDIWQYYSDFASMQLSAGSN